MVEIKLDACYLIISIWDFSLDFTEKVTYVSTLCNYKVIYSPILIVNNEWLIIYLYTNYVMNWLTGLQTRKVYSWIFFVGDQYNFGQWDIKYLDIFIKIYYHASL